MILDSVLKDGLELAKCARRGDQAVPGSVKGWMGGFGKSSRQGWKTRQDQTLRSPVGEDKEQLIG